MRKRTITLLILLAIAIILAYPARDNASLEQLAGILWIAILVLLVTYLPWQKWFPGGVPLAQVFPKPGVGEHWCTGCGQQVRNGTKCPRCQQESS